MINIKKQFNKHKIFLPIILLFLYKLTRINLLLTLRLKTLTIHPKKLKKYKGLALGRSIFNEDVKAINTFSDSITIDTIGMSYVWESLEILTEKKINDIQSYYNNPKLIDLLKKSTIELLESIIKKNNYKFIITCNYNYLLLQELHSLSKKLSIPYIVLFKEGVSFNKKISKNFQKEIPFKADKLITYNNFVRNDLIKSKIKGITSNNIVARGVPRFDFIFNVTKIKPIFKATLFSPYPFDKISFYSNEFDKKLINITKEFHIDFINTVLDNTKEDFVIKTKSSSHYKNYVLDIIREKKISEIPKNLIITSQMNAQDLMLKSEFIAGFNSTTLLEATLMKKTVISLSLKNATEYQDTLLSSINPQSLFWIKSSMFNKFLFTKHEKKSFYQTKELTNFIHTDKGDSCKQVESEIIKSIKEMAT